jgi:N-acetylglucosaminyl-diphospho-decaprenol L-rhamnosyltransferase
MKLLVVIVSYRVTELTIDCLRSLAGEVDRVPGTRVVVCENGTGGDAADRIRRAIDENGWGRWAELTAIHPNRGFTGGNNAVIRPALESGDPPEYVLLLNADTVVRDHALGALVDFMDAHPRAGIAGSQLIAPDGTVESTPFPLPGIATELARGLRFGLAIRLLSPWVECPKTGGAQRAGWVSGASLMVRKVVFDRVGLLDEGLYTYFDDSDLCLRAARAGWETWYVPDSRVVHLAGASTGLTGRRAPIRRPAYWHQARRRYYLKHHGPLYTAAADSAFILGYAAWRLSRWIRRKPDHEPPYFLRDSIRNSVFRAGTAIPWVENPALSPANPTENPKIPNQEIETCEYS